MTFNLIRCPLKLIASFYFFTLSGTSHVAILDGTRGGGRGAGETTPSIWLLLDLDLHDKKRACWP